MFRPLEDKNLVILRKNLLRSFLTLVARFQRVA